MTSTGCAEDPDTMRFLHREADWVHEVIATLVGWPEIQGVIFFQNRPGEATRVDSSPEALAAFREMANSPHFARTGPP